MATEDFSFPTITDSFSCGIDSPPLWRLSPSASPNSHHVKPSNQSTKGEESDQDEDYKDCFPTIPLNKCSQRKSFSTGEEGNKEEKMDMLWEDFNEEILKRSYSSSRTDSDMVNMGCVQALRLSKTTSAAIIAPRKPGLVAFMKVLKRLVLLHNSHRSVKNQTCHRSAGKRTL